MAKNTIPSAGQWSDIATLLNENFVGGKLLIDTKSEVDQNPSPAALDTEAIVSHGTTPISTTECDYFADGSWAFNENREYVVSLDYNVGRDGSSGSAEIYFQAKVAAGIANPVPGDFAFVPDSFHFPIGTSGGSLGLNRTIHFDTKGFPLPVHVQIVYWRDSTGTNDGGLRVATPAYAAAGVTATPSARLLIHTAD